MTTTSETEKRLNRQDIIDIANKVLAFVAEQVGQEPRLINLILDEAQHQDFIEDRLYGHYQNEPDDYEMGELQENRL